ncbi:MAG: hypothetical protein HC893_05950 [Chloroflexaceae bacterium]|nr:hypothetical protein [Chloroflexaceae bacterium]
MAGIATTLTSWNAGVTRLTMPPRATFTRLSRGSNYRATRRHSTAAPHSGGDAGIAGPGCAD